MLKPLPTLRATLPKGEGFGAINPNLVSYAVAAIPADSKDSAKKSVAVDNCGLHIKEFVDLRSWL